MGLGDLQQMTMLAVARLGADAYGAGIREELIRVAGRTVSVPTVYVTLVRLEEQGLVTSRDVAPEGWQGLEGSRAALDRLWEGVLPP